MRYRLRLVIAILLMTVILNSCQRPMPPNTVAEVDNYAITIDEFVAELSPLVAGYQNPPSPQERDDFKKLKKALMKQLIEKRLVLNEAQRMGLTVGDEEVEEAFSIIKGNYPPGGLDMITRDAAALRQWKEGLRQRLLIEKVITRISQVTTIIDERALRKYYKKHRSEFTLPEQVSVRQIVVKDRQEAEEILQKVKGGARFDELAKRHSIGPEAEAGGDLGFFGTGDMPEEFNVVFTLKAGETSKVVQSPYGYHIFQVVAKRGEVESDFADVKEQVRKMIIRGEEEKVFKAWLKKTRKKASIRVNKKALEAIGIPAPREEQRKNK